MKRFSHWRSFGAADSICFLLTTFFHVFLRFLLCIVLVAVVGCAMRGSIAVGPAWIALAWVGSLQLPPRWVILPPANGNGREALKQGGLGWNFWAVFKSRRRHELLHKLLGAYMNSYKNIQELLSSSLSRSPT